MSALGRKRTFDAAANLAAQSLACGLGERLIPDEPEVFEIAARPRKHYHSEQAGVSFVEVSKVGLTSRRIEDDCLSRYSKG
jgi:hypothetical protein